MRKPGIGGDAEGDTLKSIEKVIGSEFDDSFTTSQAGRTFEGGWGNDTYIICISAVAWIIRPWCPIMG